MPTDKINKSVGVEQPGAEKITVRGARVHNLKNVDFEIPHNALTVVTGVSGSGKSSLAFDTIYAEGQRRYVESLSAYARQFLERIEKPDADSIDGIAPAVAIKQKNSTRNPRSTVATATEIYDYLRLLYARVGRTFCAVCGDEVKKDTVDEVTEKVLALGNLTRALVLFPLIPMPAPPPAEKKPRGRKKKVVEPALSERMKERLFELRKRGFNRLWQNGTVFEFSTPESLLDIDFAQPVFLLVDRIAVSRDIRARIVDAIEQAYREAGEVIFQTVLSEGEESQHLRFAQRFECKRCRIRYDEPEPRLFSFNNPFGACPRCQGFGNTIDFDMDRVIPDKSLTLAQGAIDPWTKPKYKTLAAEMRRYARSAGIPTDVPWADLDADSRDAIVNGNEDFMGVRGFFAHLEHKKYKLHVRVFLSRYRGYATCSTCSGLRLRPEARLVKVGGKDICQVVSLTVEQAARFFEEIRLTEMETAIAGKLQHEIQERLRFLNEVGLEYLTLNRLASTLSGGEAQRIQLATSLGSRLVGTLYVLDEPSIGLHSRDTHRLIKILHDLRDLGNTILVVEHDPEVMRASNYILDLGPGAGENGGKVVAVGTYEELKRIPASLTGRYLSGELRIPYSLNRRTPTAQQLKVFGARAHNLKKVDVSVPLGMLVAVTGVSGSGKSTLVHDVLYRALTAAVVPEDLPEDASAADAQPQGPICFDRVDGRQYISDVVLVDQSPIGRTPRSNPVTYIKAFDCIREVMASVPEAQKRGLTPGHFSFNIPGGRCETCQGDGTVTVEMQFLADVELVCEECKGTRYKPEILEIKYRNKNIHEVLNLTVKEALQFFSGATKVLDKIRVLDEVGLGYLRLGQSATTLSGGEAQRMKLAAHLQPASRELRARSNGDERRKSRMLYIFDEPTTGLHFDDVSKLLAAFRKLIDAGGSILVIEHNLDVIKTADWVIDLGPEGGDRGGQVIAVGTPEQVAANPRSYTGKWLSRVLQTGAQANEKHATSGEPVPAEASA
jgi:excinuclease ABC subunit A